MDDAGRAIGGTYSRVASNPQGLWNIIMAPIIGMVGNETVSGAISISLYIMTFGAFLEMMEQVGCIKLFLKNIAIKSRKNYHRLIIMLTVTMGIFGTVQGTYEESFVYLMMFLPIVLALGMDTIVAVMIVVLGTQGGCMAAIVDPFSTGIASGIAGISPGEGIFTRIILFVIAMTVVCVYICRYADKIKQNPSKSPQAFRREDDMKEFSMAEDENLHMTNQQRTVLGIFIASFVIMILSLVPWRTLNSSWTLFEDLTRWITDIPVIGMILGKNLVPLGDWYFNELTALLIVATFASGFAMKYNVDKTISIFIQGAAGLVSTAFIVPLARGIQVIMHSGFIMPTILNLGERTLSALPPVAFVVVCLVFYLVMASFIPGSSGLAAATMSIMAPLAVFAGVNEYVMVSIYDMALGMVKMTMPTSIVVMTCTRAAHISYGQWIKTNWRFMCSMFVISSAFLVAIVLL